MTFRSTSNYPLKKGFLDGNPCLYLMSNVQLKTHLRIKLYYQSCFFNKSKLGKSSFVNVH